MMTFKKREIVQIPVEQLKFIVGGKIGDTEWDDGTGRRARDKKKR